DTVLVVDVTLQSPAPAAPISSLKVMVGVGPSRGVHEFGGTRPIEFPSSFSLQLPAKIAGPLRLEVVARGSAGQELASRIIERIDIAPGSRRDVAVELACLMDCVGDGGVVDAARSDAPAMDAVAPPDPPSCGNGRLDDGEMCDPGIWSWRPGACPPADCDDKIACTQDIPVGTGCQLACEHREIFTAVPGDRCCPVGETSATDSDCSSTCGNGVREANETCDTAAPAGSLDACPTSDACDDQNPCTSDQLISADTCAAVCARHVITAAVSDDACCPAGATAAVDNDCPAVCGNWHRDPGERCDVAQPGAGPVSCPTSCPPRGNEACMMNILVGVGCGVQCMTSPITLAIPGDRCCPPEATRSTDPDCPAYCGNDVLEPGEACDSKIAQGRPGACPLSCAPATGMCLVSRLEGRVDDCSARCITEAVKVCSLTSDGCCPSGCTPGQDVDCTAACGNRIVNSGEVCDTAIPPGMPGACPASCADGDVCTSDRLIAGGTCHARCVFLPITNFSTGDGCCPSGGHNLLDSDCPASCGNGIVESPQETCDRALPASIKGGCMSTCPALPAGCTRYALQGAPETCSSRCVLETVSAGVNGDGCCPSGCTRASDSDCPSVCGNNVIEEGETCDIGLSAGTVGSCPALCNDGNTCTTDITIGRRIDCTRQCRFENIKICRSGDRCCPPGCTAELDADCGPAVCGNKILEVGESCDPPGTCPARCADDGDACTSELLVGDAKTCNARCQSTPIRACSGATADGCCPTGCVTATDVDCNAPPPQPPLH
ncbi:MAG TPA: hypothetical protein VGG33_22800, partial [Polyangia bacterium]